MERTAVKNYTDAQILARVREVARLTPNQNLPKYLLVGIRSEEDTPDIFDDKFYLYIDGKFQLVTSGTTNPGLSILRGGFKKYNKQGAAILKSDKLYLDVYKYTDGKEVRLHRGKMVALRQVRNMEYYRDNDLNSKANESGQLYTGNWSTNFHFNSYNLKEQKNLRFTIGDWSAGCQVANNLKDYLAILELCKPAEAVSYALLKEF